jgi:hypothetical protein
MESQDLFGNTGAIFSPCHKYRYVLWRIWDESLPKAMCIGLNPSNANAVKDDPTIHNLKSALKKLGYGGFYMTNLYAFVSSKPEVLKSCEDPWLANQNSLLETRTKSDTVIFCWGSYKGAEHRIGLVKSLFGDAKVFGRNIDGAPMHPLSLMYTGKINNPELFDFK